MTTAFEKQVSDLAYNVGFGAKKHFATHDLADKAPGLIGFLSMAIGIVGLISDPLSTKEISAALLILGIVALYCSFYDAAEYEKVGVRLTQLYNELRRIREDANDDSGCSGKQKFLEVEKEFYEISITKQMLFSDIFAHFKFFYQMNITWLDNDLQFKFWKDKFPANLKLLGLFLILSAIFYLLWKIV